MSKVRETNVALVLARKQKPIDVHANYERIE